MKFESEEGPPGKIVDDKVTRKLLNWKPVYKSFRKYMRGLGGEIFPEDMKDTENSAACGDESIDNVPFKSTSGLWLPGDDDGLF